MLSLFAAALLAAPAPITDEIILVNGKVMVVEKVSLESYTEVTYKTTGGGTGRKPADQVAEIIHDYSSPLLDDFVLGLEAMDKPDFGMAVSAFEAVLADDKLLRRSTYAWVKQHALWRIIRCKMSLADYSGASASVDRLLAEVPDTFFFAPAMIVKAEALKLKGDDRGAENAYADLAAAVTAKGLSERWSREAELGKLLLDPALKGLQKRQRLSTLVEKNLNQYPTVANRANVEIGNTMIAENDFGGAERFFQNIIDDGQADVATIAAAYAGLGTCKHYQGLSLEGSAQKNMMQGAALAHLRVITLYKEQRQLMPASLYYAADALNRMGDREKAIQLAGKMRRDFLSSPYAKKLGEALNISMK